jgi:hypothetical protein
MEIRLGKGQIIKNRGISMYFQPVPSPNDYLRCVVLSNTGDTPLNPANVGETEENCKGKWSQMRQSSSLPTPILRQSKPKENHFQDPTSQSHSHLPLESMVALTIISKETPNKLKVTASNLTQRKSNPINITTSATRHPTIATTADQSGHHHFQCYKRIWADTHLVNRKNNQKPLAIHSSKAEMATKVGMYLQFQVTIGMST